jgi:hypothetical protein
VRRKRAVVLHYNPITLYPPALAGVRFLEKLGYEVRIVTTKERSDCNSQRLSVLARIFRFNLSGLLSLIRDRTDLVVVYEHLSVLPVSVKWALSHSFRLWIHFHEYTSPRERLAGGMYSRFCWSETIRMIGKSDVYTHTNEWRLQQFGRDWLTFDGLGAHRGGVIPNTPSKDWLNLCPTREVERGYVSHPVRMVYHGSVHPDTSFILFIYNALKFFPGELKLDIFSRDLPVSGNNLDVSWHKAVPHQDLPNLLVGYDVGLIIYNGHIENYEHNIPNKFWEYLACGLPVLVPDNLNTDLIPANLRGNFVAFNFREGSHAEFVQLICRLATGARPKVELTPIETHLEKTLLNVCCGGKVDWVDMSGF